MIGIVSAKVAPIPDRIVSALEAMKNSKGILQYKSRDAKGVEELLSEGQIAAEVLSFLREQTQLVLGLAATTTAIEAFLIRENLR